jgi:hypothetical protein
MKKILVSLALFGLFVPQVLFAQEEVVQTSAVEPTNIILGSKEKTGNVACFDHYRFGSVVVNLAPTIKDTVSGAELGFQGNIVNENDYPVVNAQVYVRIFEEDSTVAEQGDGNPVVDQFFLEEKMTLGAKAKKDLTFAWQVPYGLPTGKYYAAFYVVTEGNYNLLGLPFTDDVTGMHADFTVKNFEDKQAVAFDKNKVTLNGEKHNFVSLPVFFGPNEEVTAKVVIVNPTSETKTVPLSWGEYSWDALDAKQKIGEKYEVVELKAGESRELSYGVKPKNKTVSFLEVETKDGDAKSFLNIRFARTGVDESRLNFPSVLKYPLRAGEENALFTCAHATQIAGTTGNTLTMTLLDDDQNIIHQYVYTGNIASDMSGWKDSFTPENSYTDFTLKTTLERNGVVVAESVIPYSCKAIDPSLCDNSAMAGMVDFFESFKSGIILGIVILTLLALGAILTNNRKKRSRFHAWVLGFILLCTFAGAGTASAANSTTINGSVYDDPYPLYDGVNLEPLAAGYTVSYYADVLDDATSNPIMDNSSITVGTRIRLVPKPMPVNSLTTPDITWNFTGGVMGTPDGYWGNSPVRFCSGNQVGSGGSISHGSVRAFIQMSVNPPTVTTNSSGSVAAVTDLGGGVYRIDSNGAVQINFNYSGTTGRLYTQYKPQIGSCGSPNVPLSLSPRTITFNFTGVGGNNAPNAPSISGPVNGNAGTAYNFNIQGSDPDGDTVRYGIDVDNNGTVDQWQPFSGHVASNTVRVYSRSWGSAGTYTFQALTQDFNGAQSGWTSHTITIAPVVNGICGAAHNLPTFNPPSLGLCSSGSQSAVTPGSAPGPYSWSCTGSGGGSNDACSAPYLPPAPVVDLKVNGLDGPMVVNAGTNLNITWPSVSNAVSCSGSGYLWAGGKSVAGGNDNIPMGNTSTLYTLTCTGPTGLTATDTVSVALNVPFVDLKINGSDTSVSVTRGSNLNITWSPVTNGTSCTGSGTGWGGAKSTAGGGDNITANTSPDTYTLTCVNGDGVTRVDSIGVTLINTLKICENSCSSGIEPPASFTMIQGTNKTLRACSNNATSCTDGTGDVTGSVTWSDGGTAPVTIVGGFLTAVTSGIEGISAFDPASSQTVSKTVTVTCTDPGACSRDGRTINLCQSDAFTVVDNCGVTQNCNGTKSCDFNFKEVAP